MNELLLQRCVDGEMTSAERGDFLAGLGEDVVQWRQLACKLLDERELEAGCLDWIADFATPDLVANRVSRISSAASIGHDLNGRAASNGKAASIGCAVHRIGDVSSMGKPSTSTSGIRSRMALVVAGLLGIAIGLGLSGIGDNTDAVSGLAGGGASDQPDADSPADVPEAPAFRTILLTLETPDGPRQYEVPVIGADDLTSLALMEPAVSPELREQLSHRGLQSTEIPGVIKLPIDDATSVAVPVHAVQVQSVAL